MRDGTWRYVALKPSEPQAKCSSAVKIHLHSFNSQAGHIFFLKKKTTLLSCAANDHADMVLSLADMEPLINQSQLAIMCKRASKGVYRWGERRSSDCTEALLLQPRPSLQQLDDWFPFEALPLGFIKSKCKPVQQIAEKMPVASFHLWLGPDYFDKLRRWWGSQISSQWFGWHFAEIEDFSVYVSFFLYLYLCKSHMNTHCLTHC